MNYNMLGSKIRTERNKRLMSQERLSELAQITQKYLSLIETGKRTPRTTFPASPHMQLQRN